MLYTWFIHPKSLNFIKICPNKTHSCVSFIPRLIQNIQRHKVLIKHKINREWDPVNKILFIPVIFQFFKWLDLPQYIN